MIKVYIDESKNNKMELQVRSILKEIKLYCNSVDEARRRWQNSIAELKPSNHIIPANAYRILSVNHRFFEIWHHRPDGSQSYLIGSVTEEE